MTSLKLLGLATLASLVVGAVCAASASATTWSLCKTNQNPCQAANQYASGTSFSGSLKSGTTSRFVMSGGLINPTVTCTGSSFTFKSNAQTGTSIPATLTSLSLTGCSTGTTSCVVKVNGLPWSASLVGTSAGNGALTLGNGSLEFDCGTILPICTFTATGTDASLSGGNPAGETFSTQAFTSATSGCPTDGTWSASYVLVGTNTALWIEPAA